MFQLTFGLLTLLRHMKQPHPSTYHTKPSERVGGFSKKVEVPFTIEMLLRSIDLGICPRSIFHGTEFSSNRKGWVFPKAFEVSVALRVHGRPREMAMVREALPQPRPPAAPGTERDPEGARLQRWGAGLMWDTFYPSLSAAKEELPRVDPCWPHCYIVSRN